MMVGLEAAWSGGGAVTSLAGGFGAGGTFVDLVLQFPPHRSITCL
jgi:hypothetical protein